MSSNSRPRLAEIAVFVPARLEALAAAYPEEPHDPAYRWQHTLRVARYGKVLAEAEEADVELVVAACLLHDVARFDPGEPRDHGRLGAEIARPHLLDWGYSPEATETICYAISTHVDIPDPTTLTARIVSDADNIDRFGVYRILTKLQPALGHYDQTIAEAHQRLDQLREYREQVLMLTPTGQVLFNEKLDVQIAFYTDLLREQAFSKLPEL